MLTDLDTGLLVMGNDGNAKTGFRLDSNCNIGTSGSGILSSGKEGRKYRERGQGGCHLEMLVVAILQEESERM